MINEFQQRKKVDLQTKLKLMMHDGFEGGFFFSTGRGCALK